MTTKNVATAKDPKPVQTPAASAPKPKPAAPAQAAAPKPAPKPKDEYVEASPRHGNGCACCTAAAPAPKASAAAAPESAPSPGTDAAAQAPSQAAPEAAPQLAGLPKEALAAFDELSKVFPPLAELKQMLPALGALTQALPSMGEAATPTAEGEPAQASGEPTNCFPQSTDQAGSQEQLQTEAPLTAPNADGAVAAPGQTQLTAEQLAQLGQHSLLREQPDAAEANTEVAQLQQCFGLPVTGKFDSALTEAVQKYQQENNLKVDGKVGQQTWASLMGMGTIDPGTEYLSKGPAQAVAAPQQTTDAQAAPGATQPTPGTGDGVVRATLQKVLGAPKGERAINELATGQVTINGRTYQFNSGGGPAGGFSPWARGYLPKGEYTITEDYKSKSRARNNPTMTVDGVGWSFRLNDKYDPRVKDTRFGLLIHPDGRTRGTYGCLGIVGDGEVQKLAQADLEAEIKRGGGKATLIVG